MILIMTASSGREARIWHPLPLSSSTLRVEEEYGVKFSEEEAEELAGEDSRRVLRHRGRAPVRGRHCGAVIGVSESEIRQIRAIRAALTADPDLGAGNVLVKVIEHGAALDGPGITFDVDGGRASRRGSR